MSLEPYQAVSIQSLSGKPDTDKLSYAPPPSSYASNPRTPSMKFSGQDGKTLETMVASLVSLLVSLYAAVATTVDSSTNQASLQEGSSLESNNASPSAVSVAGTKRPTIEGELPNSPPPETATEVSPGTRVVQQTVAAPAPPLLAMIPVAPHITPPIPAFTVVTSPVVPATNPVGVPIHEESTSSTEPTGEGPVEVHDDEADERAGGI
ncbi:hypothetical protein QFC21_001642 [Naganishia friedmannii]|uniref:Uncharacterized protein n=1 Tax=Naganishia friedmannii TaxID=89922 RepID=A0ACC2W1T9_9TREE|nr:hypothetical protein QFC21_001642 [Naganishia friedmannii]